MTMHDLHHQRVTGEGAGPALESVLLFLQGAYWLVTGVWPLIHMDSFLAITGPKTDLWLVRTVAVLITAIGATLLLAWHRRSHAVETIFLAIAGAAGLMLIDIVSSLNGTISPIYLLDAAAEGLLILLWAVALVVDGRRASSAGNAGHLARQVM